MTDLLERTHHEPLVVDRLHRSDEPRVPDGGIRAHRRARALIATALAVVAMLFVWAERAGDGPEGDAPGPALSVPTE